MNLGGFERFFERERGEDGGHALGQHGFARSWRPDHQNVVTAGAGNFQRALRGVLAAHILEVDGEMLSFLEKRVAVHGSWFRISVRIHQLDDIEQRAHRVHADIADHCGFVGIDFGNNQPRNFFAARLNSDGQRTANAANAAVKREFADKKVFREILLRQATVGAHDAQCHRQIKAGALFLDVGRREIDGDLGERDVVTAVLQGGANSITALAHGSVRKANRVEVILIAFDAGDIHFHFNDAGINAIHGGAERFEEHGSTQCTFRSWGAQ